MEYVFDRRDLQNFSVLCNKKWPKMLSVFWEVRSDIKKPELFWKFCSFCKKSGFLNQIVENSMKIYIDT